MNVDIPAPVLRVIKKILMVATFDIPKVTTDSFPKVYAIPSVDEEIILPNAP
jgi:hypothetical protein